MSNEYKPAQEPQIISNGNGHPPSLSLKFSNDGTTSASDKRHAFLESMANGAKSFLAESKSGDKFYYSDGTNLRTFDSKAERTTAILNDKQSPSATAKTPEQEPEVSVQRTTPGSHNFRL